MAETEKPLLVKKFNPEQSSKSNLKMLGIGILVSVLGIVSGYFLSIKKPSSLPKENINRDIEKSEIKKGTVVGLSDNKTFKDSAEGKLEKGGIDGEGSHHLVRPGGESQNVYLTSSVVDLDKFVGRKVKVWGETFSAQKAGWLMDVGKLKVLD